MPTTFSLATSNIPTNDATSDIGRKTCFPLFARNLSYQVSSWNKDMRTFPNVIVGTIDYLESVRFAGDTFQPATVTVNMDGFAGAIGATGLLALSVGAGMEVTNVAAPTVSVGTMAVDWKQAV